MRCDEVNTWESSHGITHQMKRLSKEDRTLIPSFRIGKKVKDRFVYGTMQRWIGCSQARNKS